MGQARHITRELSALDGPEGWRRRFAAASLPARPIILLVRLYQVTLGPLVGGQCRFRPTCSHYAIEALARRGAWCGTWLTVRRLIRCHPWGGSGHDPVPD